MISQDKSYFYYEAFDENNTYQSVISANDEIQAYELLTSIGLNVTELKIQSKASKALNRFQKRLSKEALIFFFRQLSFALSSGISLQKAIALGSVDLKDKKMSRFISHLLLMLSRGFSFSESLVSAPYEFPLIIIEWIKVGEAKGNLDDVLEEIALFLEKDYALKREIKNQLTYPMIIIAMLGGFLVLLATYFIPMLENAYLDFGVQLPKTIELFLLITGLLKKIRYLLLFVVFIFLYVLVADYRGFKGKLSRGFQQIVLKLHLTGTLVNLYYFIPFIRILGLLLKENISITIILTVLSNERKNAIYLEALEKVSSEVLSGKSLSSAFSECYFIPSSALQMLKISEESGNLTASCLFLADYYERLYQEKIKRMIKLLEPMMIIVLGLVVLFLALAFYVPIISSYEQFFKL